MSITYSGSVPLGGGAFSHNYLASGSYSFTDVATGTTLLTVNFENCLYTARGSQASWFTTAALQGDSGAGATVNLTWNGASLPGYGLNPGTLPGGFSFGLATLNSSGVIPYGGQAPGASLATPSMLPPSQWWSEGSWSATNVPGPGVLTLIGLGGLVAARRRRA
jgi:MYXO-CTERM domain-containing protein